RAPRVAARQDGGSRAVLPGRRGAQGATGHRPDRRPERVPGPAVRRDTGVPGRRAARGVRDARVGVDPDREHGPDGAVRAPQGDRDHEARGRDQLADPDAVLRRGAVRELHRGDRGDPVSVRDQGRVHRAAQRVRAVHPLDREQGPDRDHPDPARRGGDRRPARRPRRDAALPRRLGLAMSPKGDPEGQKTVVSNRRARHDYEILERYETGIVLTGAEVKSLRGGRGSLAEAFARVRGDEVWLEGMHIPPYEQAMDKARWEPTRARKLLLHRKEIERLIGKTAEKGLALIPLRVYFAHGLAKVELGLARGKRQFEKRQAIAEREHRREIDREVGRRR